MERWHGKVAVVTGASSGIGAAIVQDLVRYGVQVVALARRENRLKEIRDGLPGNQKSLMHPLVCDVTKEEDVKIAFTWIYKNLGGADILVNNAGVLRTISILDPHNSKDLRDTIETNVMALTHCTREAYQSMKRRNVDGHVFMINSLSGHRVPDLGPNASPNIYPASKYAVTALTETYRQEFANAGTKIKATSISPGPVKTEIFAPELAPVLEKARILDPQDISEAIVYALSTKPHVQIHEITLSSVAVDFPAVVRQYLQEKKLKK